MTEQQQKLKSILDRWTACTLTIEDAEQEINELRISQSESFLVDLAKEGVKDISSVGAIDAAGKLFEFDIWKHPEPKVMYLRSLKKLTPVCHEALHAQWKEVHGDSVKLVILPDGLELVNEHGIQPERITANVGSFELFYDRRDMKTFSAKMDGNELTKIRKLSIEIDFTKSSIPLVRAEMIAL